MLLSVFCDRSVAINGGPTGGNPVQYGYDEGPLLHQQGRLPDEHPGGGGEKAASSTTSG